MNNDKEIEAARGAIKDCPDMAGRKKALQSIAYEFCEDSFLGGFLAGIAHQKEQSGWVPIREAQLGVIHLMIWPFFDREVFKFWHSGSIMFTSEDEREIYSRGRKDFLVSPLSNHAPTQPSKG